MRLITTPLPPPLPGGPPARCAPGPLPGSTPPDPGWSPGGPPTEVIEIETGEIKGSGMIVGPTSMSSDPGGEGDVVPGAERVGRAVAAGRKVRPPGSPGVFSCEVAAGESPGASAPVGTSPPRKFGAALLGVVSGDGGDTFE
jgi:hypothetical protein